ncbi:MAG TPA: hypothetical protein VKS01_12220, partial [Bryobacteraceae bacterium]|nr:hypothetical protein [Bryobacteraceae bacterium]
MIASELLVIGVLILIPLIYVQALPMATLTSLLTLPPPPPPPPPPPAPAAARPKTAPRQFKMNVLTAPVSIPKQVVILQTPEAAPATFGGVPGGVPGGVSGGMLGGILGSIPTVA